MVPLWVEVGPFWSPVIGLGEAIPARLGQRPDGRVARVILRSERASDGEQRVQAEAAGDRVLAVVIADERHVGPIAQRAAGAADVDDDVIVHAQAPMIQELFEPPRVTLRRPLVTFSSVSRGGRLPCAGSASTRIGCPDGFGSPGAGCTSTTTVP